ncbi:hypothetical protein [Clostridium paraputrificum]|uniref:hypothetical protein n=1 Tax=Clostridium paraputrificum TaxID=29363 RepID=UPI001B3C815A|nr:hypothetical protein [Clostridium paraputrificum]
MFKSDKGIKVLDIFKRQIIIKDLVDASIQTESVMFKSQFKPMKVIRLDIGIPLYRVSNGRTQVEQICYMKEHGLPTTYFELGQENIEVQKIQHDILLKLSKDSKGPIYQELQRIRMQTQNIIITSDGIVVNGNRRLASMRNLFFSDPNLYKEFAYVNAIVLPAEATEEQIELLETELQLAPETKLEYSWIDKLLKLYKQYYILKIDKNLLMDRYRFKREEELNFELQKLGLVNEYLDNYLRQSTFYKEVSKSEQLFTDIQKTISSKGGDELEVRRLMGFMLVKESRNLGDRAYGFRNIYGKDFYKVIDRFAKEEGVDFDVKPVQNDEAQIELEEIDEIFDDELMTIDEPDIFSSVKEILSNPENSKENSEKIISIWESIKQADEDKKEKLLALKNSRQALRLLSEIDITISDASTYKRIEGQLNSIIEVSQRLLKKLSEIKN